MSIYLFVYGTLKRGKSYGHLLDQQNFIGNACTKAYYQLYSCGHYPVLVEQAPGSCIEGEIWEISQHCSQCLNEYEEVDQGYYELKPIQLETIMTLSTVYAYFYLGSIRNLEKCGPAW